MPLLIIAPAATTRVRAGRDVDRRIRRTAQDIAQRQAPQSVQIDAARLNRAEPMMTTCWAVFALLANWMRLVLVPIGPVVSSVTLAPVVAISAVLLLAASATMPPVPAVSVILPPLPFKAVAVPAPSSRMIWPAPAGRLDHIQRRTGRGRGRGGAERMLPVWTPSPMVTVPVDVVWICASSALVRLIPATGALFVPPINMGRDSTDEWIVTPPAVGVVLLAANLLTVLPDWLATYRLPPESHVRATGPFRPEYVAVAVVSPRVKSLRCIVPNVGHVEIAAGVDGQGIGLRQTE